MKHVARGIERNGARRSEVSPRQRAEELSEDSRRDDPRSDEPYVHDRAFGAPPTCEGYVNPAFVGSTDGLATLEDLDRTVADGHGKQIVRLIEKLEGKGDRSLRSSRRSDPTAYHIPLESIE